MPALILLIPLILESCNSEYDSSNPLGFGCNGYGFVRVINNSWNIYQIVIDNDTIHYCAEVFPKKIQMCDVRTGNHNVKIGTPNNWVCEQDIFVNECQTINIYCNN